MTSLRRLIFPVLIGCLAFAIGIALGGGPLQADEGDQTKALRSDNAALTNQVTTLRASAVFEQGVNEAVAPKLLDGRLAGRGVTLLALPGVSDQTVADIQQALKLAGADVPVVASLAQDLLDPGKKTYVDSVVTSSLKGAPDLVDLKGESTYVRAGALLARAYVGKGSDANVDAEATKIDAELQGAKLVASNGAPIRRGTFVVVLDAGEHGSDNFSQAEMVIAQDLITGLVTGSDALVVGSTPTSSESGGLIFELTANATLSGKRVSTINVVNSAAGPAALVYALAAAASGTPGNFGVIDSEPVLPPGLAAQGN